MPYTTSPKSNDSTLDKVADTLLDAANMASEYLRELQTRSVAPSSVALEQLKGLCEPLPVAPSDPAETIELLHRLGSPATVATAAGRFYGLVVGGSLPATVGARVMTTAWDQLVTLKATSPVGVAIEQVASQWLLQILRLHERCSVGYVSGTTMGNFVCLSAARHCLLQRQGWNVEKQGLSGAPAIHIVASQEMHITVKKVLSLLGFGYDCVDYVPCDDDGAMCLDQLPKLHSNSLVLTQAGNVNSGAMDPIGKIAEMAKKVGAWVHVDGAFGLWAAASDNKRFLLAGYEQADSWVTDGHKWLNTPYDCGVAICKHPLMIHNAMSTTAPYLVTGVQAEPKDMVPELSRSARAVDMWAALRSLGRSGVQELVDRCCVHAQQMKSALEAMGFVVLNKVVINQVVATYPGAEHRMAALSEHVINSGDAWFGPTQWQGKQALRLSFSSWLTTTADVERTIAAIVDAMECLEIA